MLAVRNSSKTKDSMRNNQIALKLEGIVDFDDYTRAISSFHELVNALTKEVSESDIAWQLSDLRYGSAYVEVQGFAPTSEPVERVVSAYYVVANAIREKSPIPYSYAVVESARKLVGIINDKVTSITMIAGEKSVMEIIQPVGQSISKSEKVHAFGTLSGIVETLQRRRNSFMLYDSIFDQAVQCFVDDEQIEQLRYAWGKEVIVTGDVIRDHESGRPLEIREVRNIEIKPDDEQGDVIRQARGILAQFASTIPPEQRIQELRHVFHY